MRNRPFHRCNALTEQAQIILDRDGTVEGQGTAIWANGVGARLFENCSGEALLVRGVDKDAILAVREQLPGITGSVRGNDRNLAGHRFKQNVG